MDTTTSFNDLPVEIQEKIAPFLSRRDLAACVRVCRSWKRLFHRQLWSHIDLFWHEDDKAWQKRVCRGLKTNKRLVKSLKLTLEADDLLPLFLKQCPVPFPNLTSVELVAPFEEDYDDEWLAEFINITMDGWKRIVFRKVKGCFGLLEFDQYPFEEFLRLAAPTLEVFRTYDLSLISMLQVHELLCTAPNLKELYISGGADNTPDNWLDSTDIEVSDWVCSNLEVFGCRIGGIPRPDITRDIEGKPASEYVLEGTIQNSIDHQRQLYSSLALFTKLRELTLGFPLDPLGTRDDKRYKEHYQQYDCLAMTLDSGLDLLKGLKDLRVVGLVDMEIYIEGEKEQAWFAENWPHATIRTEDDAEYQDSDDSDTNSWRTDDDE
ncbi:hypothetical protein EC957_002667 [Mortierella hygrophila]|uniref:F-box domain-containing protein n=1 Tax=Mortierella hygrophila TaxID=979708 RepID=A0A9P6F3X8_9FUNG|nr:hypothetical protein EC957_002667 [Mortierella hygrophila]